MFMVSLIVIWLLFIFVNFLCFDNCEIFTFKVRYRHSCVKLPLNFNQPTNRHLIIALSVHMSEFDR